jgi:hypothetical protein
LSLSRRNKFEVQIELLFLELLHGETQEEAMDAMEAMEEVAPYSAGIVQSRSDSYQILVRGEGDFMCYSF